MKSKTLFDREYSNPDTLRSVINSATTYRELQRLELMNNTAIADDQYAKALFKKKQDELRPERVPVSDAINNEDACDLALSF